jgi:hypothetical protein
MTRYLAVVAVVLLGLMFASNSCPRGAGAIRLLHPRVVAATGWEESLAAIVIRDGRVESVTPDGDPVPPARGARDVDASGFYVAAITFDPSGPTGATGIRHVWVGQLNPGAPGDVAILRISPNRIRPGDVPDEGDVVAVIVRDTFLRANERVAPPGGM